MASGLKQPITQVRLTNVAIVRLKSKGHRFEIACFKNKIKDYRSGIEKDLDEVMQTRQIFTNVSKGVTANKQDLRTVFGSDDIDVVSKLILDTGEIQVSEKERQLEQEQQWKSIATLVADKTVNSDTQRPFSVAMIESSMREAHVSVVPKRSAKQQALEVIRTLRSSVLPTMQRAQMRIHLNMPSAAGKVVKGKIASLIASTEAEEFTYDYDSTVLIDPGAFRAIEEIVSREGKGRGRIDILDHKVVADAHELLTESELQALDNAPEHATATAPIQTAKKADADAVSDLPITTLDMERNGDHYDNATTKPTKASDTKVSKKSQRKSKQAASDSDSDVADVTADISTIGMAQKPLAATRKQLKRLQKKKAKAEFEESEEDLPAKPVKPKAKKKQPVAVSSSSSSSEAESSDETSSSDDEPAAKSTSNVTKPGTTAKQAQVSSSDDDSDVETTTTAKSSKRRTKR